ncbi:ATP-binding cassette domain-containing protein [Paenibacillus chitinolyticus]|uniref:ATP-binding cassette domain-containing protein n=1 Tax=Paenibacillus chitinolyticus TaxID=79263 RepID=UPI00366E5FE5
MGYLALGQPLSTLSGGECQRIKLASKLHRQGRIYILDEPTTGLHMTNVSKLLAMMNRLVDKGITVIVIEHNGDVIKQADWVIELIPEAGKNGGEVIFEGTPLELAEADGSVTGPFLRDTRV